MTNSSYLSNQFLIAMPGLMDPNFFHSVTYICEHNEYGAMGIVINQTVRLTVGQLVTSLGKTCKDSRVMLEPVYRGGPVDTDCGFVLHSPVGKWQSSILTTDDIALSSSSDVIDKLAVGDGPHKFLVALGYAGWAAGQLEHEIAENAWLNGPSDTNIIFETPPELRWSAAARLMGVDLSTLSAEIGHA
ncbi:MAG: YqgE/AlgH family protein [Thiohalomonadales bacterium]